MPLDVKCRMFELDVDVLRFDSDLRFNPQAPLSSLSFKPSHLSQSSRTNFLYYIVQTHAMDSLIPFTTSGSLVDCVDSTSVTNIRTVVPPTHTTFMS